MTGLPFGVWRRIRPVVISNRQSIVGQVEDVAVMAPTGEFFYRSGTSRRRDGNPVGIWPRGVAGRVDTPASSASMEREYDRGI